MKTESTSIYDRQKKLRPAPEDLAETLITNSRLKGNFVQLIKDLREMRMSPVWYGIGSYNIKYRKKLVFRIYVGGGNGGELNDVKIHIPLLFFYNSAAEPGKPVVKSRQALTEKIQAGLKHCKSCAECAPGYFYTFMGVEFSHVCHGSAVIFSGLTAAEIEIIKDYINYRRGRIDEELAAAKSTDE